MKNGEAPFQVISIYNNKILANKTRLALIRVRRENRIRPEDRAVFSRMSQLLQAANEGDEAISSSQIRASSEHSLQVLHEALNALIGKLRDTQLFRERLKELAETARMLSNGEAPTPSALDKLYEFSKEYGDFQSQLLKQPSLKPSFGVTVWPFVEPNKFSLTRS